MHHYAVIGQPVAHSLSPRIHAAFARQLGIPFSYTAIEVAPTDLERRLDELHAQNYAGLNLTLPHKVAAAAFCDTRSARADLAGQRVLVLGAGGAVRGIVAPLLAEGPADLVIAGRTPWKPEELAALFKGQGAVRPCTILALKGDRFDLVINATSAGHSGNTPSLPPGIFAENAVAYDLSYGRAAEPFLEQSRRSGAAQVHDGLGMLVEQAAEAFALWRGLRPDTEPVLAELRGNAGAVIP